jgi:PAS domain S-box-containing protein
VARRHLVLALALAAATAVFALELWTPPGLGLSVLQLVVVLACWRQDARDTLIVASACSALVVAGAVLRPRPPDVPAALHVLGSMAVLAGIWVAFARQRRDRRRRGVLDGEQTFRALLEAAPDAMVIVSQRGRIVLVNSQAERMFGYERHELLEQPVEILIPLDRRERHRAHRDGYAAEPRPRTMGAGLELAARRKDGSTFPVEIALGPLASPREGMLVSAAIRDITERQRTERARRDFLATLGHELRNPMAAIGSAARLLRHERVTPEQARWSQDVIEAEGRHMTRLIDDLLDLSRVARNTIELRRERVDFARIVDRVLESTRASAEQRGHDVTFSLPAGKLLLDADPVRLAQVFGNLLDNASKYTPPGGRIALDGRREGEWLVVRVSDNGIGVAPDVLPRLFDMFYRADRSLEQREGGLGIGLTLVRQLVELHGGSVEARSEGTGRGSEFIVRLRLASPAEAGGAAAEPEPTASAAAVPDPAPGRRILVADDNERAADSLGLLLRLDGHEVEIAYQGLQAVSAAVRFRPRVALLDIGMPDLNGYDVARRIRELAGDEVYLVALTGLATPEDRARGREAGFDAHLVKPVDVDALTRLLAELPPASPSRSRDPS